MSTLPDSMKKELRKEGMSRPKVLQVSRPQEQHGYPDYLLEATSVGGERLRGWWRYGCPAQDIYWEFENVDGWPEAVTP